jgi:uncharacterized protein (TIGR04141 family)
VLLLRAGIGAPEEVLRNPDGLNAYRLKRNLPFRGMFFTRDPRRRSPSWFAFVESGLAERLERLHNVSTAAVLFVRAGRRHFAFLFGYGRGLLYPDTYENDFGLRVALNTVDPDQLRSIDVRTVEELTFYTRRQASRGSSLEEFGLDVTQDLLRGVTGAPRDRNMASRLTGADSLTLNVPISFENLGAKCKRLLAAYQADAYKDRFGWIDHLALVRDARSREALDDVLVSAIRNRKTDKLYLAIPEPIDWQHFAGVRYSTERGKKEVHEDLDLEEYVDTVEVLGELSVADLRRHSVETERAEGGSGDQYWSIYSCIVFEVEWQGNLYALSGGQWFRIAKDFAAQVRTAISQIPAPALSFPNAKVGDEEKAYNAKVSQQDADILLLDRRLVPGAFGGDGIEVCDLLSKEGHFIHVKKRTRSSTLSHLFAQGTVSAEAFLGDSAFRDGLRLSAKKLKPSFVQLVPKDRPDASRYEVVYVIITKKPGNVPSSLPFFSQLHLMQAAHRLRVMGYRVSVCGVKEE